MQIRKVSLAYYKENGTFYTKGEYNSVAENWRLGNEISSFKKGQFPGLSNNSNWDGFILVNTPDGFSQIVNVGG